jgi:hypothetical protein
MISGRGSIRVEGITVLIDVLEVDEATAAEDGRA